MTSYVARDGNTVRVLCFAASFVVCSTSIVIFVSDFWDYYTQSRLAREGVVTTADVVWTRESEVELQANHTLRQGTQIYYRYEYRVGPERYRERPESGYQKNPRFLACGRFLRGKSM